MRNCQLGIGSRQSAGEARETHASGLVALAVRPSPIRTSRLALGPQLHITCSRLPIPHSTPQSEV